MVNITHTSIECGSQCTHGGGRHRRATADTRLNPGCGRHIGRVGALAVALGIGAGTVAATAMPSVAAAEPISVSTNGVVRRDSDPNDTTTATTSTGEHSRAIARGADSTADANGIPVDHMRPCGLALAATALPANLYQ